jgi:hypothetical protein
MSSFGFAQNFDDLPYSNANRETFFQQEMSSMMRFQAENNIKKSEFSIVLSTVFFSGLFSIGSRNKNEKFDKATENYSWGIRYRHGAWRIK